VRPVALLTDFGDDDHYVGVLHSILVRDAPGLERIDLTHGVAAGNIWAASFFLRCAWPHLPATAVVLAVVDPGVGTGRRAVAVEVEGRWLVAPDNGLAAAVAPASRLVVLDPSTMALGCVSPTFHGRDIFAPAAARIACGLEPTTLGVEADPDGLAPCPLPDPQRDGSTVRGVVLHVDHFGNLISNIPASWAPAIGGMRAGWQHIARRVRTYSDAAPGEVVMLEGSSGLLELAVAGDSAATVLDLNIGDEVEIILPRQ